MNTPSRSIRSRFVACIAFAICSLHAFSQQPDLTVMTSGGFTAAARALISKFEQRTGQKVLIVYGASMGKAADSIPKRLERGENADVVILARAGLDELVTQGKVIPSSCVDLAQSFIAMAVRAGSPKPDIHDVEALKQTLLNAKSIAYSGSASGIYLSSELFPKLGIAEATAGKSKEIDAEMVGDVVARGEAEIGFQQISELRPIPGIEIVGPLPAAVQKITIFSAGVTVNTRAPRLARRLLGFLESDEAVSAIEKTGLRARRRKSR